MILHVFENKVKKIKKKTNASHSKQNSSSNASSVNIVGLPLQRSRGLKVAAATSQIKNSSQQSSQECNMLAIEDYTNKSEGNNETDESSEPDVYEVTDLSETFCFCQQLAFGKMIACDARNCPFKWFHFSCVDIKTPPKGKWICWACTP